MTISPEQICLFTAPALPTATPSPSVGLSALETEGWYALGLVCRYWQQATTRKDWGRLADWMAVLATNAALYKSPAMLGEYRLLGDVATTHRKGTARKQCQQLAGMGGKP